MNNINNLFSKSFKDIESKMKELFINKIKIKENIKSIKYYENKNTFIDNVIQDKKAELNILKQLLLLKEKKKLNFDFIISKYLSHILGSNNKNNNVNQDIINKRRVNSLLEGFNNEFNYYLNLNKVKTKKKLHRYNSDLFNRELLKKNQEDIMKLKVDKNIDNNNTNNNRTNKMRNISQNYIKSNYNIINYEGNKNLKKSRENLEYFFIQNMKEKKGKIDYISFVKLIFLKLNSYKNEINKNIFEQLVGIYKINKLKDFLDYKQIKKLIFLRIIQVMLKSSEKYILSKNEEILEDNSFLQNTYLKKEYDSEYNKNKIQEYKKDLNALENINNEISDIYSKINDYIDIINKME